MNRRRAKHISKLVATQNPVVLLSIRNKFGERTEHMKPRRIYREAKKMWSSHAKGTEEWPTIKQLQN